MGYDDGFYYGQAVLVCLAENDSDNGKTITVSSGSKQWTGTVADKKCTFTLPGKGRYNVALDTFNTDVELPYGGCKAVHMAPGYEEVTKNDLETVENRLVANSNNFIFDYHDGMYGFNTSESRGADTFTPFIANYNNAYFVTMSSYNGTYGYNKLNGADFVGSTVDANKIPIIKSGSYDVCCVVVGENPVSEWTTQSYYLYYDWTYNGSKQSYNTQISAGSTWTRLKNYSGETFQARIEAGQTLELSKIRVTDKGSLTGNCVMIIAVIPKYLD